MDLVIINASPRQKGNSSLIAGAFAEGAACAGAGSVYCCLSDRKQWAEIKTAVCRGEHIVFVLPLFLEGIPGIMMEFLEGLKDDLQAGASPQTRKMAFILHGGFPEACQRRCCEQYLKKLPAMLGSEYAGILSRGDTFFLSAVEPGMAEGLLGAYRDMGKRFAEHGGSFLFPAAEAFTGAEYYTPKQARHYIRMAGLFLELQAQKQGCRSALTDAPYAP